MADQSLIEWTDATWNPITGCTMVDAGCTNCYAMGLAGTRLNSHPSRAGLTRQSGGRHIWTGEVRLNEQWLDQPLRWSKPRMIFVCAHGDLFHENVPVEWIDRVFAVMALAHQHTFQVLTKRPDRAARYLGHGGTCIPVGIRHEAEKIGWGDPGPLPIALPNVWLGTSISDQASADARVAQLLDAPAAVRFLSAEPLLGPVDLHRIPHHKIAANITIAQNALTGINGLGETGPRIDWVIVGGESGKNARPMHPDWARDLRDQCHAAGVAFFFKQWGEWLPYSHVSGDGDWLYHAATNPNSDEDRRCRFESCCLHSNGQRFRMGNADQRHRIEAGAFAGTSPMSMFRVGKKAAGRLLDGREWNQMPKATR